MEIMSRNHGVGRPYSPTRGKGKSKGTKSRLAKEEKKQREDSRGLLGAGGEGKKCPMEKKIGRKRSR